jgi:osmotically-inducible protein OsmY
MAHRYDEYRSDEHRDERGYSREPRRFINRAADEVRSWFGGREDERRPYDAHEHYGHGHAHFGPGHEHHDRAHEPGQEGHRRERSESARNWGSDRPEEPRRWSGQHDYGYTGSTTGGYGQSQRWPRDDFGASVDDRWSPQRSSSLGPDNRWSGSPAASTRTSGQDWRYGERWGSSNWAQAERPSNESRGYYEDDRGRVHQFSHRGFAGRGPKGYSRSDDRIREDVCERLTDDRHIDASDMEVMVANGEVTLAGSVHSREDKRHAEDIVESISGVREVHNNLRVSRWESGGAASPQTTGANVR